MTADDKALLAGNEDNPDLALTLVQNHLHFLDNRYKEWGVIITSLSPFTLCKRMCATLP